MNKIMGTQKGAAMLEFVVVLPFLLMLTIGIIEFSNLLMTFNTVNKLTMDASRYLTIYAKQGNGTYSLSSTILQQSANSLIKCGKITVTQNTDPCGTSSILNPTPVLVFDPTNTDPTKTRIDSSSGMITIVANYGYNPIFNSIFGTNINLNNRQLTSTIVAQAL